MSWNWRIILIWPAEKRAVKINKTTDIQIRYTVQYYKNHIGRREYKLANEATQTRFGRFPVCKWQLEMGDPHWGLRSLPVWCHRFGRSEVWFERARKLWRCGQTLFRTSFRKRFWNVSLYDFSEIRIISFETCLRLACSDWKALKFIYVLLVYMLATICTICVIGARQRG